jgi:HSP20 family molecular chaperone IbpA
VVPLRPRFPRCAPSFARRLPRNADSSAVTASLLDGVLRVAVPKAAPETFAVKVEAEPLPETLSEPRAQVALALPGLGAGDVSATITRDRALLLHVRGASAAFGFVHETLRLPERADPAAARAAMVNGIFSFSAPITPEAVTPVPVAAAEAPRAEGAAAAKGEELLLLEGAVPGLAASDFSAEVRGRTLTVASSKPVATGGRRAVRRSVLLPPNMAASDVAVVCMHGLLRVTARRPAPPARAAVPLSSTQPAALIKAPPPAQQPATPVAAGVPAEGGDAPMDADDAVPALVDAAQ